MPALKFGLRYFGLSAAYGFARGWIADYDYNSYMKTIIAKPYQLRCELVRDKLMRSIMNAAFYGSLGNPDALYRLVCRIEISVCGKDPYEHAFAYVEALNFITLKPKESGDTCPKLP